MPGKSLEVRPKPFFIRPMRSFLFDSLVATAIGKFPEIFDCALFASTLKASSNFCLDGLQAPLVGNLESEFSIACNSLLIARLHCVSYKLLKQLLNSSSSVFVWFVIGKPGTDGLDDVFTRIGAVRRPGVAPKLTLLMNRCHSTQCLWYRATRFVFLDFRSDIGSPILHT